MYIKFPAITTIELKSGLHIFGILVLCFLIPASSFATFNIVWNPGTGTMTINIENESECTITMSAGGGLAINGECTGILANQIKKLIINGDGGNNKIDLTGMNKTDFPELESKPPSYHAKIEVYGGDGNDTVFGSDLGNELHGDGGNDELHGGGSVDKIHGGTGDDTAWGNEGSDGLYGEEGSDTLDGGLDDDVVDGGEDDDYLTGGPGKDMGIGGSGDDYWRGDIGDNLYHDWWGDEAVYIEGVTFQSSLQINKTLNDPSGNLVLSDSAGVDTLRLSQFDGGVTLDLDLLDTPQIFTVSDDTLTFENGVFEYYVGTEDDDIIYIDPLSDVPRYLDGGDHVTGDTLYVDGMGMEANDDGHTVSVQGYQSITYVNFEQCIITNSPSSAIGQNLGLPDEYQLYQNYPNPFNSITKVSFSVPISSFISLKIHDLRGRIVEILIEDFHQTGEYDVQWNAVDVPSGLYLYRLESGDYMEMRKMLLIE